MIWERTLVIASLLCILTFMICMFLESDYSGRLLEQVLGEKEQITQFVC